MWDLWHRDRLFKGGVREILNAGYIRRVSLSVRMDKTRLSLDGFSRNLIFFFFFFEILSSKFLVSLKSDENNGHFA